MTQLLQRKDPSIRAESLDDATFLDRVQPSDTIGVVLSSPDLRALQRIGAQLDGVQWSAAFPIGCSVMITPVFEPGRPCIKCFCKRWLSLPPSSLSPESAAALCYHASVETTFEFRAYHPMGISAVATMLRLQLANQSAKSIVLDTSNMIVQSSNLLPVHGCDCRGHRSTPVSGARFVCFKEEISQWLT